MHYRKIWKEYYGEIPKDSDGRPYEIHHKDGNRSNNSVENLICLSIKEHYNTHHNQGDYGAAMLIAKRMGVSSNYLSEIQKGNPRPELVGKCGPKNGNIPWNKGVSGYKLKTDRKNKRFSSKLTINDVEKIREDYISEVDVANMSELGKINPKNGLLITYKACFIRDYAKKFNVSIVCIRNIIEHKSWKPEVLDVRK